MAFQRPTLAQIVERVQQDFVSRLALAGAVLRRSALYVFARVLAGATHGLYGYIQWVSRQLFPDQADGEYLVRHASLYGLTRLAATFATGNITITGTDTAVIPAGSVVQRADELQYETTEEVTISSGTATAAVIARTAGDDGNADVGTALNFISPIAGVNPGAEVAAGGIVDGEDPETDDRLRERLLLRTRKPPLGGADHDYERWAREIAGVTRVWVYPLEDGPGTVGVRFVVDDDPDSIIPDSGKVAEVQALIDYYKPVTATVTVSAPVEVALDFEIAPAPDTTAVRAAIEAQLRDLIRREAEPGGTILLSHIREAISLATGENDYVMSAPAADVENDPGDISTFGEITWT